MWRLRSVCFYRTGFNHRRCRGRNRFFITQPLTCLAVNLRHPFYKDETMKVDVYKRPEFQGQYSYLAVPEGRPIPNEATNIDWETAEQNIDLDENHETVAGLAWEDAQQQISSKGYAISSVQDKVMIGPSV
jgi:hypothetical protein